MPWQGRRSLWDRGHAPNIYEGGRPWLCSHNILEVISFILSSNHKNCCLLYFNAHIMCSFTKKASASGGLCPTDAYRGSAPGPHWGTWPPVFFYVPPIILWDRRRWMMLMITTIVCRWEMKLQAMVQDRHMKASGSILSTSVHRTSTLRCLCRQSETRCVADAATSLVMIFSVTASLDF